MHEHPERICQTVGTAVSSSPSTAGDTSRELLISEADLLCAHIGREDTALSCVQLRETDYPALIASLGCLGTVTASSDNLACSLETLGHCQLKQGPVAKEAVVTDGLHSLSLQHSQWHSVFAVSEMLADGALQRSLRFFDDSGKAVLRLKLGSVSNQQAFADLVRRFATEQPVPGPRRPLHCGSSSEKPDDMVELARFRAGWASLRSLGDLQRLKATHGLTHRQALRLAAPRFAQALPSGAAGDLLSRAAQLGMTLNISVSNPATRHEYRGAVHRVALNESHLHVTAARLNLLLREDLVDSVWLLRQPTVSGLRCSVELLDAQGALLLSLGSANPAGHSEPCGWRHLLDSLCEHAASMPR